MLTTEKLPCCVKNIIYGSAFWCWSKPGTEYPSEMWKMGITNPGLLQHSTECFGFVVLFLLCDSLSSTCCWSWAFPQSCTGLEAACSALQQEGPAISNTAFLSKINPRIFGKEQVKGEISVPPSRTHCRMFARVVQHSHFFLSLNLFAHFIWMKDSQGLKLLLPDSSILHYIIRYK